MLRAIGAGAAASSALAFGASSAVARDDSADVEQLDTNFLGDDVSVQSCWTETKCEDGIACSSGGGCLQLERTCCDGIQSVGTSETSCGKWEESGCCTC